MSEKENKKGASFKVTDRRMSFDEDEPATTTDKTKTSPEQEVKKEEPKEKKSVKERIFGNKKSEETTTQKIKTEKQGSAPLPEINFAAFIHSLSISAMFHIGEIPNPETGKTEKNLPIAKQSIDIIEMLKEKTKGNLASDEEKLLDNLLYDLRMKYVNALKS